MFLPICPSVVALFIAHLFRVKNAPYTVHTYISAFSCLHKIRGFTDPSKVFFIVQILKGYRKLGCRLDSRLPITLRIFQRLIGVVPAIMG